MPRASVPRRWRMFAEHLLRDPNATRAARAIGIKESNARRWAYRTKNDARFQAYFAERLAEAEEEAKIATHRVLEELAIVAHSSVEDFEVDATTGAVTVKPGVPPERIRAVSAVDFIETENIRAGTVTRTAKLRLWDKNTALGNAMKHRGLLVERHEHTGKDGGPIEVDSVRDRIADRLARLAGETKESGS